MLPFLKKSKVKIKSGVQKLKKKYVIVFTLLDTIFFEIAQKISKSCSSDTGIHRYRVAMLSFAQ